MATYHNTQTEVLVGDHVEFKTWAAFWRGWQAGRVYYVPGVSPKNAELERDGMSWVAVHTASGGQAGIWVEPTTQHLRKTVRFVRRSDDSLTQTPIDYRFGDEPPLTTEGVISLVHRIHQQTGLDPTKPDAIQIDSAPDPNDRNA